VAQTVDADRVFAFQGCFNFRDLGGYPTRSGRQLRWRRLFRSDGLHRLTRADHSGLAPIGLRTIIDLRTTAEADEHGCFDRRNAAEYHHLPLIDVLPPREEMVTTTDAGFVAGRYLEMLRQGEDSIREALAILTDASSYPAVFHCTAGRDRTGIVAAVLLGLVDVPDATIGADYVLSREPMVRMLRQLRAEHPGATEDLDRYADAIVAVSPETMERFLVSLRHEYDSFEGYARSIDMAGVLPYLRAALVDMTD
jgi:protein-tyrosine phosphatase